ncbi:MAG: HD domain-containing protein [Lachnospiraceae bacterium]|nr:HD domain-containing protein [Lachnospiraceae bacterium]
MTFIIEFLKLMWDAVLYYWPRVVLGLFFAFTFAMLTAKRDNVMKRFLPRLLLLFIISGPVVAIINEVACLKIFEPIVNSLIKNLSDDGKTAVMMVSRLTIDGLAFFIPIIIFSRILKERYITAGTVYLMYVLMDRFGIVVSTSAVSYFLIIILTTAASVVFSRSTMKDVMRQANFIEWGPVFHYQWGLFILLDTLYAAIYIFPGIENGVWDLKTGWINFIAIVSYSFFIAFTGLNMKAAKEQAEKMLYLQELQDGERDIIQKFAEISEAKSGETGQHVRRFAEYSAMLAKECGLNEDEVNHIRVASMMHDVGKLLIPREIIEKPGNLTDEERNIMQQHTQYGNEILSNSGGEVITMAREIAYQHHEHWDGNGYPRGLKGQEISLSAQIVSVADVYDALTSKRAYKEPWDRERARTEIIAQRGRQFSPEIVDIFDKHFYEIAKIQDTYKD